MPVVNCPKSNEHELTRLAVANWFNSIKHFNKTDDIEMWKLKLQTDLKQKQQHFSNEIEQKS